MSFLLGIIGACTLGGLALLIVAYYRSDKNEQRDISKIEKYYSREEDTPQ